MKRVLTFPDGDPKNEKRFELLLTAVHCAGDKSEKRNRETIFKEARIFDALDAISDPAADKPLPLCANCGCILTAEHMGQPATREQRTLKPGAHTIALDGNDYKLLESYVELTPWLPSASRSSRDLFLWFDTATKQD